MAAPAALLVALLAALLTTRAHGQAAPLAFAPRHLMFRALSDHNVYQAATGSPTCWILPKPGRGGRRAAVLEGDRAISSSPLCSHVFGARTALSLAPFEMPYALAREAFAVGALDVCRATVWLCVIADPDVVGLQGG